MTFLERLLHSEKGGKNGPGSENSQGESLWGILGAILGPVQGKQPPHQQLSGTPRFKLGGPRGHDVGGSDPSFGRARLSPGRPKTYSTPDRVFRGSLPPTL